MVPSTPPLSMVVGTAQSWPLREDVFLRMHFHGGEELSCLTALCERLHHACACEISLQGCLVRTLHSRRYAGHLLHRCIWEGSFHIFSILGNGEVWLISTTQKWQFQKCVSYINILSEENLSSHKNENSNHVFFPVTVFSWRSLPEISSTPRSQTQRLRSISKTTISMHTTLRQRYVSWSSCTIPFPSSFSYNSYSTSNLVPGLHLVGHCQLRSHHIHWSRRHDGHG